MTYQFHVDGEIYIGRTVPGAARMRIFHSETNEFLVAFDPDIASLRSRRPSGSWSGIPTDAELTLLEALQPQILSACRARLSRHDRLNRQSGYVQPSTGPTHKG